MIYPAIDSTLPPVAWLGPRCFCTLLEDAMKSLRFACLSAIFISTVALAQNNPVPLINQPLVPASITPGSGGFSLTVNGTGFVSGSIVDWNGSPRVTEVISNSQLKATINAADV